jgi:hypothetical protein
MGFSQFRKYSNEFLNIGAGARGLGMGAANAASVSDGTAGYWNPAALVGVQNFSTVNLMHASYFDNIGKYDYASFAIPEKDNKRVLGLSVLRFAVDDIPNTLFWCSRMAALFMEISPHFHQPIMHFSFLMRKK